MGESGRSLGLEVMRKSKLKEKYKKKPKQLKLLDIMVPNFVYSNSYHFLKLLLSLLLLYYI